MKSTLVSSILALVVWSSCANCQTVTVDKHQLQKDVWIANAKFNIDTKGDYKLIAIAAGLHAAYTADPSLKASQLQSIIQKTDEKFLSWQKTDGTTSNPNELYEKTLTLMSDAASSESFKAAAAIAKDLLAMPPSAAPEDDWRNINAFQSSVFSVNREREAEVLEEVFTDAQSSSSFQSAFDGYIGSRINGLTTDSSQTLLDHNPNFAQTLQLKNLQDTVRSNDKNIQIQLSDVETNLNTHIEDLADVVKGDQSVLHALNQQQANLAAYIKNVAAQQQAAQLTQQRQQLDQLQIEAADAAFQIFGKLIPGKAGQQISQAGQVAVKVTSEISNFVNHTSNISSGLGAVVLTGKLLSAASSLGSIFGGGPSQLDVTSSQLKQLSQQVGALQEDMDARLNRIDRALAQIYDQQSKDFQQIMATLETVQVSLSAISDDLSSLRAQLTGVQTSLIGVMERLDGSSFYKEYNASLHYFDLQKHPMPNQEFDEAQKEYAGAILLGNTPPEVSLALPARASLDGGAVMAALRGDIDKPIFNTLRPEDINVALAVAGIETANGPLINPHLWIIATSAYLDLANQPMQVARSHGKQIVRQTYICQASKADQFIAAGDKLKSAMTAVALAAPDDGHNYSTNKVFGDQIDNWNVALAHFRGQATLRRDTFVKLLGLDPWLAPDQPSIAGPNLGTYVIKPCSAADTDAAATWGPVSLAHAGFLPKVLFNASHFIFSDAAVSVCLTKLSYSTFLPSDRIEHGGKYYSVPDPPCKIWPAYGAPSNLVPCEIDHMSAVVALTAIARIQYHGKHLADVTFTTPATWGISENDWAHEDFGFDVQVVRQWAMVEAALEAALSNATLAPDSGPAIAAAQTDLQGFLATQRKALIATGWLSPLTAKSTGKGDLRDAADQLSDNKTALWALAQIGLPSAFDQDQEFHAFLSDSQMGLLDRLQIIEKLRSLADDKGSADDTQQFNLNSYLTQARQARTRFEDLLDQKIATAKQHGGDLQVAITNGLVGLHTIQQSYTNCTVGHPAR
jgi:hypothetical protein